MTVTTSACRLCHSDHYITADETIQNGLHYTIVRCVECSLVYIRETYADVSPEYTSMTNQDLDAEHIWLQTRHKEPAFRQCLKLVRSFYPPKDSESSKRKLLDVGCGIGGWLKFAESEYECYGFDASPIQIAIASQNFPRVRCATSISEYQMQLGHHALPNFDLITLWDVLEHIRRPAEFLTELSSKLSFEGLLFASVPAELPMLIKNRLLPFGWPRARFSWNPREHVAYYSPKTLRMLCEKAHLQVVRIGTITLYPRPLSIFELMRRVGFWLTSPFPQLAPQIYVLAGRKECL